MTKPTVTYRRDYTAPTHWIDEIDLRIELGEERTVTVAKSHIRINPDVKKVDQLVLNGEEQTLRYIKINDQQLVSSQYELGEKTLTLKNIPDRFTLEIQTEIKPQENTALMGLYKSNDLFCTKCESEGFRKITCFLDRPDVLAKYTTTIVADKKRYPILLSNGNLVASGELESNLHWVRWEDPFKKPSYLFAMVAGDLDYIEDYFVTMSGREIQLRIFCENGYQEHCKFAMTSLKKAMQWDEEKYSREYDLNLFMIVAVSDFNSAATENKGLNIFNSKYIFARSEVATDQDYEDIDRIVAHEYFHNWTGNRITCRDWFQLSLKEGLTVFRDQDFSEDTSSYAVKRIDEVMALRESQFSVDLGPLAHPVRPNSYIEIRSLYTTTVYEKGAEIIRMMRIILGKESFRRGMDLYFNRFDGQAVTCDDFAGVMEDASGVDLTQFKLWYSQAGTPELHVTSKYDSSKKQYILTVKQNEKLPMLMPLSIALLAHDGSEIPFVLNITQPEQIFVFENIAEKPILSLLRDFSAPVKLFYAYNDKELVFLMENDKDPFARFEAGQRYMIKILLQLIEKCGANEKLELPEDFVLAFKQILLDSKTDKALIAKMINLPSEIYLADLMTQVNVEGIYEAREFMRKELAEKLKEEFEKVYKSNLIVGEYKFQVEDVAKRSLKNACLGYLTALSDGSACKLAVLQFENANNMTDKYVALDFLSNTACTKRKEILESFYNQWKQDSLVVDKWFAVWARSFLPGALEEIKGLLKHPDFNIKKPNRVYALLRVFATANPMVFHTKSGEGYRLLADQILILDKINPNVAASLVGPFAKWRRLDQERQRMMKEQLERILNEPGLSKNVYELVSKSLK
ncbi:Aminopeptidase N [Gammaproteobacteria bacterium]